MRQTTPELRDFAKRLISIGVEESKFSASKPQAVFIVLDKLRPCLTQVVGVSCFSAVLSRALASANLDVAWLRQLRVKPDSSLDGLDDLEAKVNDQQIAEGRVVLIAEFLGLLIGLIGERLVLQMVHQALPNLSKDDLYFGEGSST